MQTGPGLTASGSVGPGGKARNLHLTRMKPYLVPEDFSDYPVSTVSGV